MPKAKLVRRSNKRIPFRPARSHRERSGRAQHHPSCDHQRSHQRRVLRKESYLSFAMEFSMHPHPSFEIPRCLHCGLIQFRRTIAKCVRCKSPLDDFATVTLTHAFTSKISKRSKEAIAQRVGVAVKTLRKERKFTQQQLAMLMGTGRSYISKLESGRIVPSLQTLESATSAFGIDLAELFLRLRRQT